VSDQLLTFLKYIFLALLYLFFLRVLRAVWIELREPKPEPVAATGPAAGAARAAAPGADSSRRGRRSHGVERLVILEPVDRKGQEFPLGDELTVGRAAGCGVALPDDTFVSQLHARVFRREGDLQVEDLGSTNGTYLNHKKVTAPVPMRHGDKLQIGKTTMEVRR
jgi:hypothetical protein